MSLKWIPDVIPFWDKLAQCQSYLSMQLQLPWLLFLGHWGLCDAVVSLFSVHVCAIWMNLETSQNIHTHTYIDIHTVMAHGHPSPPSPLPNLLPKAKGTQMWGWTSLTREHRHTKMFKSQQEAHSALTAQWVVKRSANRERNRSIKGRWGNIGKLHWYYY